MPVRHLTPSDVARLTPLMAELGYPTTTPDLAERVAQVSANPDDAVLIAKEGECIVGMVAVHSFQMLHRPGRMGRITALVVATSAQGRGIGSELLAAAESHLRQHGCVQLEVTSAEQRLQAHGFYGARGYHEKRVRFVKSPAD
jgi:ribosomal protein S18 acetylase RimI-like enzyme